MTTRRGFLAAMLAAAAAPAIVRAESLMPVAPRIWTPPEFGFYEGFRFIATTDNVVTMAMIQRMTRELQRMKENRADGGYWVTIHPDWRDLK